MQLNGEEKRIRALFCELRLEDRRVAPSFTGTWSGATADVHRSSGWLQPIVWHVAAALLVICFASGAAALLRRYSRTLHRVEKEPVVTVINARMSGTEDPVRDDNPLSQSGGRRPKTRPRQAARKTSPVAIVPRPQQVLKKNLFAWRSPTSVLLRSSGEPLLRSGPQVAQSARAMKNFLANAAN